MTKGVAKSGNRPSRGPNIKPIRGIKTDDGKYLRSAEQREEYNEKRRMKYRESKIGCPNTRVIKSVKTADGKYRPNPEQRDLINQKRREKYRDLKLKKAREEEPLADVKAEVPHPEPISSSTSSRSRRSQSSKSSEPAVQSSMVSQLPDPSQPKSAQLPHSDADVEDEIDPNDPEGRDSILSQLLTAISRHK
mmetsp:Transcript_155/g.277  ORF Transcript_155/g.277 Transcript_155/m.277 type:complete len:192 (-) Transcript_155:136-711(-)